jgi:molybdopterin-guanine dinucleotide biosynthesis protein A
LLERALAIGSQGAVVRYRAELQPTFSIWHRSLLPRLKRAVHDEAMAGFKQFLQSQELAELDWPSQEASPFFNINDPSALHAAGQLINATDRKSKTCSA